ncbi:MAG TPA: zf-HC2 domain-containing protein [Symbiobacteriaceae bacterium]|nr:zf-HC2 domain-containing protein [Symbiobacteriaceae bacterium]
MNFRCDDGLLQMYLDGDMSPVERELVEVHLKTCPRCASHVGLYKGLLFDLEHAQPEPVPEGLAALSDSLMVAWAEAQAPATWQEASRGWIQNVPGLVPALSTAGRVGRSLPRLGLTGLASLGRWLWRGGGGR